MTTPEPGDDTRERVLRYAQRKLINGRLTAPGPVRHGDGETFLKHGCRCHYCERADRRLGEAWAAVS